MKRIYTYLIIVITICCLSVNHVEAQAEFGTGLAFGTENGDPGLFVKGRFRLFDQLALSPNVTYFFIEDSPGVDVNFFTVNVDAHYLFEPQENIIVYPLLGFQLGIFSFDVDSPGFIVEDDSETEFGLNIGGGGQYNFNDFIGAFLEVKYVISDFDQAVISLGVMFNLN